MLKRHSVAETKKAGAPLDEGKTSNQGLGVRPQKMPTKDSLPIRAGVNLSEKEQKKGRDSAPAENASPHPKTERQGKISRGTMSLPKIQCPQTRTVRGEG